MKATPIEAATALLKLATETGFTVTVDEGILRVNKTFTPGSLSEFTQSDIDAPHILALCPSTSTGSVWGTDGGGVGAVGATERGQFELKKSGGSKRVLSALTQLLTPTPTPKNPSMKKNSTTATAAPAAAPATISPINLAIFRKDLKAELAARAKAQDSTPTKLDESALNEILKELINDGGLRERFTTDEEFTLHFKATLKPEMTRVGKWLGVAPVKLEELEQLPNVIDEILEASGDEVAQPEPAPLQVATASADEEQEEENTVLNEAFYVVELHEKEAVVIPFLDVDTARQYAKRRNAEQVLAQVATQQQAQDRYTEGSMLFEFNLFNKPYRFGEKAAPLMKIAKSDKTAAQGTNLSISKPEAPATAATPAAAAPAPAKATAVAKPATAKPGKTVEALLAAEVNKQKPAEKLQPAPVRKPVVLPAEGAPLAQVLQAKLAGLITMEDYQAFEQELASTGHQLNVKARSKPVVLLYAFPSDTFEQVFNLRFGYAGQTEVEVVSKSYLHVMPKYFEVVKAA